MAEIPTIASLERSYSDIVDAARRQVVTDLSDSARLKLARIYIRELDAVFTRLASQEITEETARGMIRSIERALRRYLAQAQPAVKEEVFRALKHMQQAHINALDSVPGRIEASFSGVPTEAFEEMYKRRLLGVVDSFKTLRRYNATIAARQIEKTLEATLLEGIGPDEAVVRIARSLAEPDDFMRAAFDRYASRPSRKFMRAGRKFAHVTDEAFLAAKRLSYDAWRIVRTEMAAAAIEGDRIGSIRSTVVAGMKWNLSPRHPKPDICDLYAKLDLHGMGAGVFPPELYPPLAHPHDLCFSTHTFRSAEDWGTSKAAPAKARRPSRGEVSRILSGETANAIRRAHRQVRRDTKRAADSWTALQPKLAG